MSVLRAYKGKNNLSGVNPDIKKDYVVNNKIDLNTGDLIFKHRDYKLSFILNPLIVKGGNNILGAERGTGKTTFSLCLAFAINQKRKSFIGYEIEYFGNVLYLNFDMKEALFTKKVEKVFNGFKNLDFEQSFDTVFLSFLEHKSLKIKDIPVYFERHKPKLIIVDTLKSYLSFKGKEDGIKEFSNINSGLIYEDFEKWNIAGETTILLLNHLNKGTSNLRSHSDLMFGPGSLLDQADQTLIFRKAKEPNQFLIVPDKQRFVSEGTTSVNLAEIKSDDEDERHWIELINENVSESDFLRDKSPSQRYPKEVKLKALELSKTGKTLEEIAEILLSDPKKKGTVSKWINKLKKE